ncbi:hypothetical protein K2173_001669 [Erythroxylum novogranatense]|uniref:Uncharacterized protein n=1 Tax=Erythroxylum novogranatense TaxID=1862640 RepID=A0AAV8T627_9ROSI|nr:hypothetical protein K2173_001669 [Erythroxylum novogranatense]
MDLAHGSEVSECFQAQSHIYKHMYSFIQSMCLKSGVELGIPDIINKHGKPISLQELVSALNIPSTKADSLRRLMRVLVHCGLFATSSIHEDHHHEEEERYVLTNSSRLLLEDSSTCLSSTVLALLNPSLVTPWFSLGDWFQGTDLTPFESFHGSSCWDHVKENHQFIISMKKEMACDSRFASLIVLQHVDIFNMVTSLVDVGGGTGTLARTICEACPQIECTVLDLPQVVKNLPETKNLKFVGGDMFKFIPSTDAIVIKSVLHNWNDECCIKILKQCKRAIQSKDGGKVILIEILISDKKDEQELNKTRLFVDLEMMLATTGRERNKNEWEKIFLEAGFREHKIRETPGLFSIIEVYP